MDPERQRQIARQGGKAAHERGSAHEFTSDEARAAGRKGGVAVSQNRAHMAEIGRRGGEARGAGHRRRMEEARRAATAEKKEGETVAAQATEESPQAEPESTVEGSQDDAQRRAS
ncbi:stress-induced protein [Pendulispora brunnea]|uniref:Stress-induced protein n=2 Tax=Pendulispora brunnea TaxID=2905690 RepID=A0ABZ2KQG0_9BACT